MGMSYDGHRRPDARPRRALAGIDELAPFSDMSPQLMLSF
jgi:hypothetical protein